MQQALKAAGVVKGDRVAAMLPNLPESVALMLAVTSIGAIFSSCSPDFGERGVLDRFGQIEPKVFVSCDGYWYAGKKISGCRKAEGHRRRIADGGNDRDRALSRRSGRGCEIGAARGHA
jgi:acetoacetyl-CoA synthetase